ncbi:YozE family protein [Sphingomonas sp. AOB5]|uniref:YozE family protein n=1 Tax=Sphingomonas sp. AOB5 TaxID=3034017 RepID=UPI0023F70AE1|nr:YozE family protein [Sphingomonas sp. AOB5]MDF7777347.1 YozE family protein [Sphingomonas sp. AOB5]
MPQSGADARYHKPKPTFGRWLLKQGNRTDAVGALAKAALTDPHYPLDGDADAISARLNKIGADSEMHHALEDAWTDWACW